MAKPIVIDSPYRVEPGNKVKLSHWPTDDTGKFKDKAESKPVVKKNLQKLKQLQELFYAQGTHGLLIVLQAMDAGGKDGAISHVFSGVNPQGCQVTSFKIPSTEEKAHAFLWRYHMATPRRGMIGIFNRSHYESVLVERVHNLTPEKIWSKRYDEINHFEQMMTAEGYIILKFFLHISKHEQKRRLQARLDDPAKNWKLSPSDVAERQYWDQYTKAYEEAMEKCSTDYAPWYVVPADNKWFRNWVLSDTIVRAMGALDLKFPKADPEIKGLKIE